MLYWYDLSLIVLAINLPMFVLRNKYGLFRLETKKGLLSLAILMIVICLMQNIIGYSMAMEVSLEQLKNIFIAAFIWAITMATISVFFRNSILYPIN
jgi:hypothetical protein